MVEFDELKKRYSWKPIYGCPGRFVLKNSGKGLTLEDLAGDCCPARLVKSTSVPDPVLVLKIKNGGLISFCKKNGIQVITLNTEEGFLRKITMLGLNPDQIPDCH